MFHIQAELGYFEKVTIEDPSTLICICILESNSFCGTYSNNLWFINLARSFKAQSKKTGMPAMCLASTEMGTCRDGEDMQGLWDLDR